MKKALIWMITIVMILAMNPVMAQETPPALPNGQTPQMQDGQTPPAAPDGTMPPMQDGQTPPAKPDGEGTPPGGFGGGDMQPGEMGTPPGGMGGSSQPESYASVLSVTEDSTLTGSFESVGTDENAVHVSAGNSVLTNAEIKRASSDSTGGDNASFYGVGAAVLVTGGTLSVSDSTITTDANGGAGVFAYGSGVADVSNTTIHTTMSASGGIHVAGGGTLNAKNLTVVTDGASSAAIRSDRGGGTMTVDGGSYTANGSGSPAVYVTANIDISNADLTATGSEALCLEGKNSVKLTNCNLSGNMPENEQNETTWTVILYQSMSGDSELGKGTFEMTEGTLTSLNGGLFYTTNTQSEFTLNHVQITAQEGAYLLRCTGNTNQRGWGSSGSNGADCIFNAIAQEMSGDIQWDSISTLTVNMSSASTFTGAVVDDESCAGAGGNGSCTLNIENGCVWVVTGNSTLTNLNSAGFIMDASGNPVSIIGTDGTVYVQGNSEYTVTVTAYSDTPAFN